MLATALAEEPECLSAINMHLFAYVPAPQSPDMLHSIGSETRRPPKGTTVMFAVSAHPQASKQALLRKSLAPCLGNVRKQFHMIRRFNAHASGSRMMITEYHITCPSLILTL